MNYANRANRLVMGLLVISLLLIIPACSPLRMVSNLSADDSVVVQQFNYGDNKRQKLDMYLPEHIMAGSPIVVFFYGGSWKRGEKEKYGFVGHSLSRKGYIIVIPDYRLFPEVTFPTFVEDGALAISWLQKNIAQAKNGIVVMGHSAGAHTAALLALDENYLEEEGHSFSIIRGMIGLAGPYGFDPRKYRSTRPIFSGSKPIEKTQPVTFACSAQSPFLLFHGEDDTIVVAENSRELKRKIDSCGGTVEYIELGETGHFSIVTGLSNSFLENTIIVSRIEVFLQSISAKQAETHSPG